MSTEDSPPAPILGSRRGGRTRGSPLQIGCFRLPQNWGRGGLLLVCLLVRLVALASDPPAWLSWSTGLYTDEGFYTLDARHEALFGTWAPGNFHDRLLSPLLSVLQQGMFSLFGVGLVQARLLSVVFGLLTVCVLWLGLRRAFGTKTADYGALFLGLAPPFALYNRTALQETPTVFWLVLAFTLWVYGARRPALYALSGISMAVAVVFKGLALLAGAAMLEPTPAHKFATPPVSGGGRGLGKAVPNSSPLRFGEGGEERAGRGSAPLLGTGGAIFGLVLYAAFWYALHHVELSRMGTYYRVHQMQPHSWHSLWLNERRAFVKGEHGVFPYLLATLPVPCLLAGWGVRQWRTWRGADRFLALWLAGGLLFCLLSSYAPSRYYVLFLPALMGLAAHSVTGLRRPVQIMAVAIFLLVSAGWYGAAWTERAYVQRDGSRELARRLPPGSVVIGDFAPALCLNTPFSATTVQPGLANDNHPVEHLHATHVVVVRNAAYWQNWWRARYPNVVQPSHRIATYDFGDSRHYVVDVYAVKETR